MASPDPVQPAPTAELLAKVFYGLSQSVDDYRIVHWQALPDGERARLKDEAQMLDTRAHYFTAEEIGATLQSIASSLEELGRATASAKAAVASLKKAGNIVRIATASAALAAAIAAGDPGSILSALGSLGKTVMGAREDEGAQPD